MENVLGFPGSCLLLLHLPPFFRNPSSRPFRIFFEFAQIKF